MKQYEIAQAGRARLGEGAVWDPVGARLLWVDLLDGLVHRLDPDTGLDDVMEVAAAVGVVRPRRAGGLVMALQHGFASVDAWGSTPTVIAAVEADDPTTRFNDGTCDPAGRFWAGTMDWEGSAGRGSLYRLDRDGSVERILSGVGISNGIAWSPDGTVVYYVDSLEGGVDVFDYDSGAGQLYDRRRLITIERACGLPDGLTIDEDGCIWLAIWGAGVVRRYTSRGRLEHEVPLPASQVTSCCFGGRALDTLYVTSARISLAADSEPLAGSVFACSPGARGLPTVAYAG